MVQNTRERKLNRTRMYIDMVGIMVEKTKLENYFFPKAESSIRSQFYFVT